MQFSDFTVNQPAEELESHEFAQAGIEQLQVVECGVDVHQLLSAVRLLRQCGGVRAVVDVAATILRQGGARKVRHDEAHGPRAGGEEVLAGHAVEHGIDRIVELVQRRSGAGAACGRDHCYW